MTIGGTPAKHKKDQQAKFIKARYRQSELRDSRSSRLLAEHIYKDDYLTQSFRKLRPAQHHAENASKIKIKRTNQIQDISKRNQMLASETDVRYSKQSFKSRLNLNESSENMPNIESAGSTADQQAGLQGLSNQVDTLDASEKNDGSVLINILDQDSNSKR